MKDGVMLHDSLHPEKKEACIQELFMMIKLCYKHMLNGAVLIHCRNGANRATLIGVCFLVAMTGCSCGTALSHVMHLRALTDICEKAPDDKYSRFPDPMVFLESIEDRLRRLCIYLPITWVNSLAKFIKYLD